MKAANVVAASCCISDKACAHTRCNLNSLEVYILPAKPAQFAFTCAAIERQRVQGGSLLAAVSPPGVFMNAPDKIRIFDLPMDDLRNL